MDTSTQDYIFFAMKLLGSLALLMFGLSGLNYPHQSSPEDLALGFDTVLPQKPRNEDLR